MGFEVSQNFNSVVYKERDIFAICLTPLRLSFVIWNWAVILPDLQCVVTKYLICASTVSQTDSAGAH